MILYFILLIIFILFIILNSIFSIKSKIHKKKVIMEEKENIFNQEFSESLTPNELQNEEVTTKPLYKEEKKEEVVKTVSESVKEHNVVNYDMVNWKDVVEIKPTKSVLNQLDKLPPYKRAIIFSEILGKPKGIY